MYKEKFLTIFFGGEQMVNITYLSVSYYDYNTKIIFMYLEVVAGARGLTLL